MFIKTHFFANISNFWFGKVLVCRLGGLKKKVAQLFFQKNNYLSPILRGVFNFFEVGLVVAPSTSATSGNLKISQASIFGIS